MWPMVWIYQIVTGVTSVVGVPSTHLVFTEFAPNGPIVNNSGNSLAPKVDKPKGMLTYRQLGP